MTNNNTANLYFTNTKTIASRMASKVNRKTGKGYRATPVTLVDAPHWRDGVRIGSQSGSAWVLFDSSEKGSVRFLGVDSEGRVSAIPCWAILEARR